MAKQPKKSSPRPAAKKAVKPARPKTAKPAAKAAKRPLKAKRPAGRPAKAARPAAAKAGSARGNQARGTKSGAKARPQAVPAVPAGPSSHDLAVEAFERGFRTLQQRQFGRAAELLGSIVRDYPEEKELQERARVYLAICERQSGQREAAPRSFEDRVYAATLAINRGAYDEGLTLLRKLEGEEPANDHVQYMLSIVHTLRSEPDLALAHLRHAVELNPENRYLATQDVDLEPLRQEAAFLSALEVPSARRRAPHRRK
jgi:tetratricopeptide (TPR) repeat protein